MKLEAESEILLKYVVSCQQACENLLSVEPWHCWKSLLFIVFLLPVAVCLSLDVAVCSLLPSRVERDPLNIYDGCPLVVGL